MDAIALPLLWAQSPATAGGPEGAGPAAGISNPVALAMLALRRWFSSQTLCSPQAIPTLHGLWVFLIGLAALLLLAMLTQGPMRALRQVIDVRAHAQLVRLATARVWKAGRLVAVAISFTVLAWTGSQTLSFLTEPPEKGRADLTLLTRSRGRIELAVDQGILASLTPLRDVAALGDNLVLLICAIYLVFRAFSGTLAPMDRVAGRYGEKPFVDQLSARRRVLAGWSTPVWGCGALYALYRLVARFSGSTELPLGGCLVIEAVLVPLMMVLCDGFLLAWLLAELREASFDGGREERFHPSLPLELMPAAVLCCALVLPSRYIATLVMLSYEHLPTSVGTTPLGQYIRWQLGWGLIDFQAAALVFLGLVGVTAWSRGSISEVVAGFVRLLRGQGGHLAAATAMAGVATGVLAALIYPVMLLLPPAGWVLAAADSYAHYLTLPVGLWTLAAVIELAQRSLPVARLATAEHGRSAPPDTARPLHEPGRSDEAVSIQAEAGLAAPGPD